MLLLLPFVLALALAAPAAAQDVETILIEVEGERESGVVTGLTASILVEGERIARAALTPPGATEAVELPRTATGFGAEETFANEEELATGFPGGRWRLTLNGTREYAFDFELLPVPSPAISAPLPGAVLVPGDVTVGFRRCLFCSEDTDSTEAEIVGSDAFETLEPGAERWLAEVLDENAELAARITHTAERTESRSGGAGDQFELVTRVVQSDEVPFFTGAAPPTGAFCIAVGGAECGPGAPAACIEPDAPGAMLANPSGSFALRASGIEMEYDAEVQPGGAITGAARADLDGDGSLESQTPLRGSLRGSFGRIDRSVSFDFRTTDPVAKLAVRIRERGTVEEGVLDGKQKVKGSALGARVSETLPSTAALGEELLGWCLDLTLAGKDVDEARIQLSDGTELMLTGRFLFDFVADTGALDLRSADGASVKIEGLVVDDLDVAPPTQASGVLTFRILGQRSRFTLE